MGYVSVSERHSLRIAEVKRGFVKVYFIIVGAMKAGTSSLGFHLNNHPDVYLPEKELQYFNDDTKFNKGYDYYYSLFKPKGEKVIGEKTPTYSYQENVAERIYKFNPDIKLIWIFRNPVDRAYSNYLHAVKNGSELLSFDSAVENESERIKSDIWKGYVERSIYIKQVERYLKWFKIEQMHFIVFEEFKADPEKELKKVFDFLQVDSNKSYYAVEERNKTVMPRSPKSLYYVRKYFGAKSFVFKVINKINTFGKAPGYQKMSDRMKKVLESRFIECNKELQNATGLDLTKWDVTQ